MSIDLLKHRRLFIWLVIVLLGANIFLGTTIVWLHSRAYYEFKGARGSLLRVGDLPSPQRFGWEIVDSAGDARICAYLDSSSQPFLRVLDSSGGCFNLTTSESSSELLLSAPNSGTHLLIEVSKDAPEPVISIMTKDGWQKVRLEVYQSP